VIIDILIVLVVIGAAWVGFQRGLVQPLLAEILGLGTLILILHNREAFAAAMQALFHANAILAVFMALVIAILMGYLGARIGGAVHRMPVVRGVDGFLGVWMQALIAIGFMYVLISGVIVMNKAFTPIVAGQAVNLKQLDALERAMASNALTSALIDGHDLSSLAAQAAKPSGAHLSDVPQVTQVQGIFRDFLQPQVAGSRLAPLVMRVGQHLPGLGPYGPRDLPKRA
jgi:hypothetical protein